MNKIWKRLCYLQSALCKAVPAESASSRHLINASFICLFLLSFHSWRYFEDILKISGWTVLGLFQQQAVSYSGAKMDFGACLTGLESCFNDLLVGGKQVKAQFHPEKDIQVILPWISIVFPENIPERGLRGFWELFPNSDEILMGKEAPDFWRDRFVFLPSQCYLGSAFL